jgi:hypothetical protein
MAIGGVEEAQSVPDHRGEGRSPAMPAVNFQPLVLPPGTGAPGIPGRESAGLRDEQQRRASGHDREPRPKRQR